MRILKKLRKAAGCSILGWTILSLFLALAFCQVSWAQGDNLWNIRENGDDRFHDNEPWLRPWRYDYDDGWGRWVGYWSYEVLWGPVSTVGNSDGSFSISRSRDTQFHVWTYVRVETDQTISLYGDGDCVPRAFVNYAFDSPIGFVAYHASLALNSGWNRIDITGYNQNEGYGFTCGALAELVDAMNSYEILNQPPIADAGPDQTKEQTSYAGTQVTLDGSGSSDPDGDELTYEWTWSIGEDTYNATGINPTIELPVGEHTIQLIVNDGTLDSEPDYVEITILPNLSGWVWEDVSSDFCYSLDQDCLLYFYSFVPVLYYNITTGLWAEDGPVGWIYVDWPFIYELDTDTLWFVLPPESGLWVYHFCDVQWYVLPRIIP
jgi:hypothetical protein